jgi:hypothetical protein
MTAKQSSVVPPRDIHIVDVPEEFADYVRPGETDVHMVVDEHGQGCLYFAKSPSGEHIDLVFLSQDTTDKFLDMVLPNDYSEETTPPEEEEEEKEEEEEEEEEETQE